MTIFNWTISQLERNTNNDYVTMVHYRVKAIDEETIAETYGVIGFEPDGDPVIPYVELSKETVISWVQEIVGKEAIENSLQSELDISKNATKSSGLPWTDEQV